MAAARISAANFGGVKFKHQKVTTSEVRAFQRTEGSAVLPHLKLKRRCYAVNRGPVAQPLLAVQGNPPSAALGHRQECLCYGVGRAQDI